MLVRVPHLQSDGVIVEGLKDGAAGTVSTDMFAANGANREFYNAPLRMGEQILFVGQIQIMQGVTPETLPLEGNLHLIKQKIGGFYLCLNGGGGSNLYDPNHYYQ